LHNIVRDLTDYQASVWEQCACTKMGKHSAGDQTQDSHIQQVSGDACYAVRWSRKGTWIFWSGL